MMPESREGGAREQTILNFAKELLRIKAEKSPIDPRILETMTKALQKWDDPQVGEAIKNLGLVVTVETGETEKKSLGTMQTPVVGKAADASIVRTQAITALVTELTIINTKKIPVDPVVLETMTKALQRWADPEVKKGMENLKLCVDGQAKHAERVPDTQTQTQESKEAAGEKLKKMYNDLIDDIIKQGGFIYLETTLNLISEEAYRIRARGGSSSNYRVYLLGKEPPEGRGGKWRDGQLDRTEYSVNYGTENKEDWRAKDPKYKKYGTAGIIIDGVSNDGREAPTYVQMKALTPEVTEKVAVLFQYGADAVVNLFSLILGRHNLQVADTTTRPLQDLNYEDKGEVPVSQRTQEEMKEMMRLHDVLYKDRH